MDDVVAILPHVPCDVPEFAINGDGPSFACCSFSDRFKGFLLCIHPLNIETSQQHVIPFYLVLFRHYSLGTEFVIPVVACGNGVSWSMISLSESFCHCLIRLPIAVMISGAVNLSPMVHSNLDTAASNMASVLVPWHLTRCGASSDIRQHGHVLWSSWLPRIFSILPTAPQNPVACLSNHHRFPNGSLNEDDLHASQLILVIMFVLRWCFVDQ